MSTAAAAEIAYTEREESNRRLARLLAGRLAIWAEKHGDKPALREKRLGRWQEIGWREYYRHVQASGLMLKDLGIVPGDHVAILSDNRPEWLYADLGAQGIGARSVGIYQTNPAAEVAYILNHCGAKVLFCEDQEQVDKALEIREKTPSLQTIVVFDPRGIQDYDDDHLLAWADFLAGGMRLVDAGETSFEQELLTRDPGQPSMVVYTSGTTGQPKGALLTNRNAVEPALQTVALLNYDENDTVLSYLPLCHVAEKIFSQFLPLASAAVVHFGEAIETVQDDLRDVSPTVFLGVPRIWEKMHASVLMKMHDSSWLKRTLFEFFVSRGRAIARRKREGKRSWFDAAIWALGDLLIYRPLQERLGLRNCRLAVSGAAPISPDLLDWFHGVGIEIVEGFGQTECGGASHMGLPNAQKIGTVGRALPFVECRTAEDGEILIRGVNVFAGYLNNEEATAETVDSDGWLHTGDVGEIDADGFLKITGRKKEILVTSGGKNLSPERIENALKMSPYIKEAIAVGDNRNFVSALVQIEYETVGAWATSRNIAFTSFADLAGKPGVVELIGREIERANESLARVETVRAFRLFDKELSQDDGELTATQKIRRRNIIGKYAETIESMYGRGGR